MAEPKPEGLIERWKTQLVRSKEQDENPAEFVEILEHDAAGGGPQTGWTYQVTCLCTQSDPTCTCGSTCGCQCV